LAISEVAAVVHLLEVMIHDEDDALTEEDLRAVATSREYFRQGGEGVPFEQVVADCGFTIVDSLWTRSGDHRATEPSQVSHQREEDSLRAECAR
jgi:hypothetical protein